MAARGRRVVWTPSAQTDLDGALEYITADSLTGAQKILHATLDLAASLETLSERGRVVPEPGDLAFLHGARDFARWRRGQ